MDYPGVLKCLKTIKHFIINECQVYKLRVYDGMRREKGSVPDMLFSSFFRGEQRRRWYRRRNWCWLCSRGSMASSSGGRDRGWSPLSLLRWFCRCRSFMRILINRDEKELKMMKNGLCGKWFGWEMKKLCDFEVLGKRGMLRRRKWEDCVSDILYL